MVSRLRWAVLALLQVPRSSIAFLAPTAINVPLNAAGPYHATRPSHHGRTLTSSLRMSSSTTQPTTAPGGAVIVGGGPSGLATALMLAKRGWRDISVIERTPSADFFDPLVAFVYQIDGRGQTFLKAHGLMEKLAANAVDSREFIITRIPADKERQEVSLPIIDKKRPAGYWLPRNVFQQLLLSEVESKYPDAIKVFYSSKCDSIEQLPEGQGIEVKASLRIGDDGRNGDGEDTRIFRPRLLVGADGLKSMVRRQLQDWDVQDGSSGTGTSVKKGEGRFDMHKQPSGSSGLRFKVLTLPPKFRLGNDDDARSQSDKAYMFSSKFKDSKRMTRIGILPWGPVGGDREGGSRGANFITRSDHHLWGMRTGEEMKAFLVEAFPQTPLFAEIDDEELSRFAQSEGGRFPDPQYCPGLHWLVDDSSNDTEKAGESNGEAQGLEGSSRSGVALVGDAIHAFPPDLGQGVNAALEDVVVLERALANCGDRVEDALPEYERTRAEDCKALVRLCQIGFPWQYQQPSLLGAKLWFANFMLRTLVLGKIFPKFFGEQVFKMIQTRHDDSYSAILADADRTTRRIWGTALTIAVAVVLRRRLGMVLKTLATAVFSLVAGGVTP